MRDTALTICLNPLHRAHRIPAQSKRIHGDVVPDAIELVEAMIAGLLAAYPGATINLRQPDSTQETPSTEKPVQTQAGS
jgi:hypothetical protein